MRKMISDENQQYQYYVSVDKVGDLKHIKIETKFQGAKFPDAVKAATGVHPELPAHLADLMSRTERMTHLANDQAVIERFITDHTRAGRESRA